MSGNNFGHGHVHPRPDGVKARCGGPALCSECAVEQARLDAAVFGSGWLRMDRGGSFRRIDPETIFIKPTADTEAKG